MKISDKQIVDLKKNDLSGKEPDKKNATEKKDREISADKNIDSVIEWKTDEFAYHPKTAKWFVSIAVFFAAVEVYFLWTRSFFASVTFLLIFFVILLYSVKKPEVLSVRIDYKGIAINNKLYKFDEFQSFWIFYNPDGIKKIFLRKKNIFGFFLNIPIGEQDPTALRDFLQDYLSEIEEEEPFIDALMRKIGF